MQQSLFDSNDDADTEKKLDEAYGKSEEVRASVVKQGPAHEDPQDGSIVKGGQIMSVRPETKPEALHSRRENCQVS